MPREMSGTLRDRQLAVERRPVFRVRVYDLKTPTAQGEPVVIRDIVLGNTLPAAAGPLELTDFVEQVLVQENASNSTTQSIAGNAITLTVADRRNRFDPVDGSEGRWLRQGNVITLEEGDAGVPGEWIKTFTGTIVGQAGSTPRDRAGGGSLEVQAQDRMAAFLKTEVTGREFGQQTLFLDIATALCEEDMGLAAAEFEFGNIGLNITEHASTQIVAESPMVALAKLFFADAFAPFWKGDGTLTARQIQVGQAAARVYENDDLIQGVGRPFSDLDQPNVVEVLGLEGRQTRNLQERTVIATASLTLGFFGGDAEIGVQWSDDGALFATEPSLNVLSSVTGALIPFGAESLSVTISDEELDAMSQPTFQGSNRGRIDVEGSFYAPLVTTLFAARIASSAIPDLSPQAPVGALQTIPIGRLIEGAASIAISTILATIGRGQYEVVGRPYEYVLKEIRGQARVAGLDLEDERTIKFENHLLNTQALVDGIAQRELLLARKRGNVRNITMRHDLLLEAGDAFRRANGRSYIIQGMTRTIARNGDQTVEVQAFETTAGVTP